jgi:hypothetical protein
MLGHESEPRLGALALGNVHQRQQDGRLVTIGELTRIDRQINQGAVDPDMLPGAARLFVMVAIAGPRQFGVERLQAADRQPFELGAAVAIVVDRRVVDAKDFFAVRRTDDHRHRVAVEQQPKRGLVRFYVNGPGAAGKLRTRFCRPAERADHRRPF